MSTERAPDPAEIVDAATQIMEVAYADLVKQGLEREWEALTPVLLIPLHAVLEAHANGMASAQTLRTVAGDVLRASSEMRSASNEIEREALQAIALASASIRDGNN